MAKQSPSSDPKHYLEVAKGHLERVQWFQKRRRLSCCELLSYISNGSNAFAQSIPSIIMIRSPRKGRFFAAAFC